MNPENISDNGIAGAISLRLHRPSIVVLCGPAACGKSTFAQRHFRPTQIISSDWARAHICDDERDQRFNTQAFALVHFLVEQRLMVNRLCVVDSTAVTSPARKDLVDLAKKHHVPSTLILFHVPLETCIERDQKRERSVGSAIVERQFQAFEQSKEAIRQEGFDQVVEYHDRDLERVQIEILFRPVVRPAPRPERPDPGARRRFERSAHPSRPRPSGPGDYGHTDSAAPVPAVAQSAAALRPAMITGSVSTPKTATPQPEGVPAPVGVSQSTSAAHPPASLGIANKPSLQPQGVVPPKPAPTAAPRPIPPGAQNSGTS